MELTGYPVVFLYSLVIFGMILAVIRPYGAFLVVVFLLSAADAAAFTATRTPFLGPFFNANDACLFIALTATFVYTTLHKKKIIFPPVTIWIVVILLIGFFQSWFILKDYGYELIRFLRWALTFPMFFFIAAVLVDNDKKVKYLLGALLFGAIVSAIEHISFVRSRFDMYFSSDLDIGQIRSIAFRSPGIWFLLAGIVWIPRIKWFNKRVFLTISTFFIVSVLLNQTRSIWVSSVLSLPILFLIFKKQITFRKLFFLLIFIPVVCAAIYLLVVCVTPNLSPGNFIRQRAETLIYDDLRFKSTITRQVAFYEETSAWREGTLIFGRGLGYFMPFYRSAKETFDRVAWGHLGHISILAQLGLIGFVIYSVYLPLIMLKVSKCLWTSQSNSIKFLGLLAAACMVSTWILHFMSDSFLGPHPLEGIIFGGAWGAVYFCRQERLKNEWKETNKNSI